MTATAPRLAHNPTRYTTGGTMGPGLLVAAARRVARDVAAPAAAAVDAMPRLPTEALAALRAEGLLGAAVPRALGGQGAAIRDLAGACFELGQGCSSAAMLFAMHQIQVACLVQHGAGSAWHEAVLRRVADGMLLASGTTESTFGGDVRNSDCAVAQADGAVRLLKDGCVISYASAADAVLVTARRTPDSPTNDQVLLVAEASQLTLDQLDGWDALGMRGTESCRYRLAAACDPAQILPAPYAVISAETMLPVSHILWAALWLGIATDAAARARAMVRGRARRGSGGASPGTPAGAARLAEVLALLQTGRATLADAVGRYEAALGQPDRLGAVAFALALNALKLQVSELVIAAVTGAMQAIGLAGYRNTGPYSVARHLRDVHSSVLMIGNDRIRANNAALMAAYRAEEPLFP